MSDWGKVPREVFLDDRLTRRDIRVLGILCTHADGRTGVCTRKQEAIAAEIGADRSGVNRSMQKLVSLGYVATRQRAGMKRSLEYRVLVREGAAGQLSLFDAQEAPRHAKPKRAKRAENGTSVVPSEGTSVVPSSGTSNKQTPVNRGGAASRERVATNDQPIVEPQPDAVPVVPVPGAVPRTRAETDALEDRLVDAARGALDPTSVGLRIMIEPIAWLGGGCDLEFDILPTIAGLAERARARGSPIRSWSYFAPAVLEARNRRLHAARRPPDPSASAAVVPFEPRGANHARPDPQRKPVGAGRFDAIAARRRAELAGRGPGGEDG